jgi:hypothetical protein|tara:strand:- start:61 stop:222 length:162 start_codon:yes stop_codon:yes gene_type:complete
MSIAEEFKLKPIKKANYFGSFRNGKKNKSIALQEAIGYRKKSRKKKRKVGNNE